jgi:Family of unknown function (DUF6152)
MRRFLKIQLLLVSFAIFSFPSLALAGPHHREGGIDWTHTQTLVGTVKEWRWTSPHVLLYLQVQDGEGVDREWILEGTNVVRMIRAGWRADSLQPGEAVRVRIARLLRGENWGALISVTAGSANQHDVHW